MSRSQCRPLHRDRRPNRRHNGRPGRDPKPVGHSDCLIRPTAHRAGNPMCFWQVLREQPDGLARVCTLMPHARRPLGRLPQSDRAARWRASTPGVGAPPLRINHHLVAHGGLWHRWFTASQPEEIVECLADGDSTRAARLTEDHILAGQGSRLRRQPLIVRSCRIMTTPKASAALNGDFRPPS